MDDLKIRTLPCAMMCNPLHGSPSEKSNSPVLNSLRTVRAASIFNSVGVRPDKSAGFPECRSEIGAFSSHLGIPSNLGLWSLHLPDFGMSHIFMNPQINTTNFNQRPFIAIWEVTQACDLACVHCRASAQPDRSPMELSTDEGKQLIDQIAALKVPVFVLTGGDPIKRPDLFELIGHARSVGVRVSLTPSATPLLTKEVIVRLKEAGLARLAVSMDGASAETHDAFRGMSGSFARTLDAVRWANEIGLPVQINTTFSRRNINEIDSIVALMEKLKITLLERFLPRSHRTWEA